MVVASPTADCKHPTWVIEVRSLLCDSCCGKDEINKHSVTFKEKKTFNMLSKYWAKLTSVNIWKEFTCHVCADIEWYTARLETKGTVAHLENYTSARNVNPKSLVGQTEVTIWHVFSCHYYVLNTWMLNKVQ